MLKSYLGDAVYVEFDGYSVVLTTSNGLANTNTIFMEPVVREAFKNWLFLLSDALSVEDEQHLQPPAPEPGLEEPEDPGDAGAVDQGV